METALKSSLLELLTKRLVERGNRDAADLASRLLTHYAISQTGYQELPRNMTRNNFSKIANDSIKHAYCTLVTNHQRSEDAVLMMPLDQWVDSINEIVQITYDTKRRRLSPRALMVGLKSVPTSASDTLYSSVGRKRKHHLLLNTEQVK